MKVFRPTIGRLVPAVLALALAAPAAGRAQTVVLEYTHVVHMLAERDPEPLLRVYADGRVRVHYPVYMTAAGDYETRLSEAELTALFEGLAADGVFAVDLAAERERRRAAVDGLAASGVLYEVSDTTTTVIRLRKAAIDGSVARGAAGDTDDLVTLRWDNVYPDTKDFPELAAVRAIARAEERLQALVDRVVEGEGP